MAAYSLHQGDTLSGEPEIVLLGERLVMLPTRALHWPDASTLFICDPLWGKAAAFHKTRTILETTRADLERVTQVAEHTGARRIIFMGDLLHPRAGRAPETLEAIGAWRLTLPDVAMMLVQRPAANASLPEEWGFNLLEDGAVEAPFLLTHQPIASAVGYVLVGGTRPGAPLSAATKQKMLYPCFWFGPHTARLPAFGTTTGLTAIKREAHDRLFAMPGERIVPLG